MLFFLLCRLRYLMSMNQENNFEKYSLISYTKSYSVAKRAIIVWMRVGKGLKAKLNDKNLNRIRYVTTETVVICTLILKCSGASSVNHGGLRLVRARKRTLCSQLRYAYFLTISYVNQNVNESLCSTKQQQAFRV